MCPVLRCGLERALAAEAAVHCLTDYAAPSAGAPDMYIAPTKSDELVLLLPADFQSALLTMLQVVLANSLRV